MNYSLSILRWVEETADALARLDAVVGSAHVGVGALMMLRTALEIARRTETGAPSDDRVAALLGWWYAVESREFIADPGSSGTLAMGLDGAVKIVRAGQTPLRDLVASVDAGTEDGRSTAMESVLAQADEEVWPSLLLVAELCTGACAPDTSARAAIVRAVAPMAGGLTSDVFVAPAPSDTAAEALQRIASAARHAHLRVSDYLMAGVAAKGEAAKFGRGAPTAWALIDLLERAPAVTVIGASVALDVSVPSTGAAVRRLHEAGLVREITGRGRDRVFVYEPAIALAG